MDDMLEIASIKCPDCPAVFFAQYGLDRHSCKHIPQIEWQPPLCEDCGDEVEVLDTEGIRCPLCGANWHYNPKHYLDYEFREYTDNEGDTVDGPGKYCE